MSTIERIKIINEILQNEFNICPSDLLAYFNKLEAINSFSSDDFPSVPFEKKRHKLFEVTNNISKNLSSTKTSTYQSCEEYLAFALDTLLHLPEFQKRKLQKRLFLADILKEEAIKDYGDRYDAKIGACQKNIERRCREYTAIYRKIIQFSGIDKDVLKIDRKYVIPEHNVKEIVDLIRSYRTETFDSMRRRISDESALLFARKIESTFCSMLFNITITEPQQQTFCFDQLILQKERMEHTQLSLKLHFYYEAEKEIQDCLNEIFQVSQLSNVSNKDFIDFLSDFYILSLNFCRKTRVNLSKLRNGSTIFNDVHPDYSDLCNKTIAAIEVFANCSSLFASQYIKQYQKASKGLLIEEEAYFQKNTYKNLEKALLTSSIEIEKSHIHLPDGRKALNSTIDLWHIVKGISLLELQSRGNKLQQKYICIPCPPRLWAEKVFPNNDLNMPFPKK